MVQGCKENLSEGVFIPPSELGHHLLTSFLLGLAGGLPSFGFLRPREESNRESQTEPAMIRQITANSISVKTFMMSAIE